MAKLVEKGEGRRGKAYDDATGKTIKPNTRVQGYVTVGVGRNLVSNPLTVEEQDYLLQNDISRVIRGIERNCPWFDGLDNVRRAVVVDMVYNLGISGFLKFERTIDHIRNHRYAAAAQEMLNSLWARQIGNRAVWLSEMMETGEWG